MYITRTRRDRYQSWAGADWTCPKQIVIEVDGGRWWTAPQTDNGESMGRHKKEQLLRVIITIRIPIYSCPFVYAFFEFIPWFFYVVSWCCVDDGLKSVVWSTKISNPRIHLTYLCGTLKLILNEIHKILPFNRVWLENVCVCLSRRAWHLCVLIGRLDRREVIFVYIYANIIWMMFGRWTTPRPTRTDWMNFTFVSISREFDSPPFLHLIKRATSMSFRIIRAPAAAKGGGPSVAAPDSNDVLETPTPSHRSSQLWL